MQRHTLPGPILFAAVAACVALPSSASAASLSCSQAKAAVTRELKRSKLDNSPVSYVNRLTCNRLSSKRAKVRWQADTQRDVATGNVGGHSGYALVRKYSYGIDVSLVVTDD